MIELHFLKKLNKINNQEKYIFRTLSGVKEEEDEEEGIVSLKRKISKITKVPCNAFLCSRSQTL